MAPKKRKATSASSSSAAAGSTPMDIDAADSATAEGVMTERSIRFAKRAKVKGDGIDAKNADELFIEMGASMELILPILHKLSQKTNLIPVLNQIVAQYVVLLPVLLATTQESALNVLISEEKKSAHVIDRSNDCTMVTTYPIDAIRSCTFRTDYHCYILFGITQLSTGVSTCIILNSSSYKYCQHTGVSDGWNLRPGCFGGNTGPNMTIVRFAYFPETKSLTICVNDKYGLCSFNLTVENAGITFPFVNFGGWHDGRSVADHHGVHRGDFEVNLI
jgi:hypothetical protein